MAPFRYPGSAGNGNATCVISNEDNGSDGEAFIEHFQARQLGPVVGVPSWGGLVGILNAQLTIDNGSVNQPNNAFYGDRATGGWKTRAPSRTSSSTTIRPRSWPGAIRSWKKPSRWCWR